jgi:O-antigen/teichoic acid export membrane protein
VQFIVDNIRKALVKLIPSDKSFSDTQSSYRQIMKATSLFGGVQVINIIIGIIRTKLVAVLLGTAGIGVLGLLNTPLTLIASITGLGISFSAIRDISEAAGTQDEKRISDTLTSFRRWVLLTGILGMIVTIILAPWLSQWTFDNDEYTWAFIWLSSTFFINAISGGQLAILQGMRRLQNMAKATVIGSALGLFISIPLYYYFGTNGIPAALIITALVSLLISRHFARNIPIARSSISYKASFQLGLKMVKLGIVLTISGIVGAGVRYVILAFISREGGPEKVGLYQAGFGLISTYVGMIFTAMGADYFPRLAAINDDNKKCAEVINHQITIAATLIAPLCVLLLSFLPLAISLLYTKDFLPIVPMGEWLVLSTFLKVIVWAVGYLYLAKGALKTAFIIDNLMNVIFIVGYIFLYKLIGLEGIGIADFILYSLALPLTLYVSSTKYDFSFNRTTKIQLSKYGALVLFSFVLLRVVDERFIYLIGSALTVFTSILAIVDLNKYIGILSFLKNRK